MPFNSKEYAKQYYLTNRDRILAQQYIYNDAHREEKRLRDRLAYYAKKEKKQEVKKAEQIKIDSGIKISFE